MSASDWDIRPGEPRSPGQGERASRWGGEPCSRARFAPSMLPRHIPLPLAVAMVAAALCALTTPAASFATSVAGQHRVAIDSRPDFSDLTRTAERHQYVILQAWQADKMRALKAVNPDLRVLVYKNLSASIASSNQGVYSTGVSYQEADEEHPEWFLRNRSGERFSFRSFSYLWAMDVGSSSYQRRWAENVIAELEREGWDGVFVDDTNTTMRYHYAADEIAKYPSDAAWQEATESALAHIGPRVQAAGKLIVPNIGSWGENPAVGRRWLQYVSGAMDEMFVKWGNSPGDGYAYEGRWAAQVDSLAAAQRRNKHFIAVTHSSNDDRDAARYGWATVLLAAEGEASFALHGDYTHETWFPEYEYDLGAPVGDRVERASGLHVRKFENGIVVVNPTSTSAAVNLPGSYSGSGFKGVSRVRLQPNRAAILLRDDTAADEGTEASGPALVRGRRTLRGGKIVATGKLRSGGPGARATSRHKLRLQLKRGGRIYRSGRVKVRRDGRFVGRARVCKRGRYRVQVVDLASGKRVRWPRPVRVSRLKTRC